MNKENSTAPSAPHSSNEEPDNQQLEKLGIARITTATYIVGDYRYTSFKDALAEAKRRGAVA
ncbi:MAG: hypothetical protein P8X75_12390 [Limibacillus sp.]|jgi:hypothetical protein